MSNHDEHTHTDTQAKAEAIASDPTASEGDVRRRISDLVAGAAATPGRMIEGGASAVQRVTREVLEGASRGAHAISDERKDSVMAETLEGLGEGLGKAAHATQLALEEARSRGESFAKDDVKAAIEDLRTIEDLLRDSGSRLAKAAGSNAKGAATDLTHHAGRVFEGIRPAVEGALREAMRHPVATAGDAAATAVDAARMGVGSLFDAAGGLLKGAGGMISGKKPGEK